MGRPWRELEEVLTAGDLALYQAAVEIDGPWWGEREAAHLRQLCSISAAAAGADIPPEGFAIDWTVGPRPESEPVEGMTDAEGLRSFAGIYGLEVKEVPNG